MLCAATKSLVAERAINKSIRSAAQKSNTLDRLSETLGALAMRTPNRSLSISENATISRSTSAAIVCSVPSLRAPLYTAQHSGTCQHCDLGLDWAVADSFA